MDGIIQEVSLMEHSRPEMATPVGVADEEDPTVSRRMIHSPDPEDHEGSSSDSPSPPRHGNRLPALQRLTPRALLSAAHGHHGGGARAGIEALIREKIWHIGALGMVFGSILNFISLSFAAQSLLAGLSSVQFVSNVFFVRFVLGENITNRTLLATSVIVAGQVILVSFAPHEKQNYNVHDLIRLYRAVSFIVYMFISAVIAFVLFLTYRYYTRHEKAGHPLPCTRIVRPVAYAMSSAIVGTLSMLQAKCLAVLLHMTQSGDNQLKYAFTYLVLLLWVVFMVFWLYRMNHSLKLFEGVFIIPVLQVFWMTFTILDGFIYFQEYRSYDNKSLGAFISGVLIIFGGVYLLSPPSTKKDHATAGETNPVELQEADWPNETPRRRGSSFVVMLDARNSAFVTQDIYYADVVEQMGIAKPGDEHGPDIIDLIETSILPTHTRGATPPPSMASAHHDSNSSIVSINKDTIAEPLL